MQLFIRLHEDGQTVILVTHEPGIARYAHRVVTFLDGLIVRDEQQTARRLDTEAVPG